MSSAAQKAQERKARILAKAADRLAFAKGEKASEVVSEQPLAQRRELVEKIKSEVQTSSVAEGAINDLFTEEKLSQKPMPSTTISIDELSAIIAQQTAEFDAKHAPPAEDTKAPQAGPETEAEVPKEKSPKKDIIKEINSATFSTPPATHPSPLLSPTQTCLLLRSLFLVVFALIGSVLSLPEQPFRESNDTFSSTTQHDTYENRHTILYQLTAMLFVMSCTSIVMLETLCQRIAVKITTLQGPRSYNY